jgi:hypothetical protein
MPVSAIKTVAKAQVCFRRSTYSLIRHFPVLITTAERRRSLCPPMQVPHLPLLQLVGVVQGHERLPQSLPARIRQAQPSD